MDGLKKEVFMAIAAFIVSINLAGCNSTADVEIDLFKMYDTEEGTYLLDPQADTENVIFVPKSAADSWGASELDHGAKVTGVFDYTRWDLLEIVNEEEESY